MHVKEMTNACQNTLLDGSLTTHESSSGVDKEHVLPLSHNEQRLLKYVISPRKRKAPELVGHLELERQNLYLLSATSCFASEGSAVKLFAPSSVDGSIRVTYPARRQAVSIPFSGKNYYELHIQLRSANERARTPKHCFCNEVRAGSRRVA